MGNFVMLYGTNNCRTSSCYRALNSFFSSVNPVAMSVGTFVAFAVLRGNLQPYQAFQALTLFQQMLWPLMLFPATISAYLEMLVSLDRIEDFLSAETVTGALRLEDAKKVMDASGMPIADSGESNGSVPGGAKASAGGGDDDDGGTRAAAAAGLYLRVTDADPEIALEDASFSWGSANEPTITGATLKVVVVIFDCR